MKTEPVETVETSQSLRKRFQRGFSRWMGLLFRSPGGTIGFVILLVVILSSLLAGMLSPYDPAKQNIVEKLLPRPGARAAAWPTSSVRTASGATS